MSIRTYIQATTDTFPLLKAIPIHRLHRSIITTHLCPSLILILILSSHFTFNPYITLRHTAYPQLHILPTHLTPLASLHIPHTDTHTTGIPSTIHHHLNPSHLSESRSDVPIPYLRPTV